jgi:hypothetical protein
LMKGSFIWEESILVEARLIFEISWLESTFLKKLAPNLWLPPSEWTPGGSIVDYFF